MTGLSEGLYFGRVWHRRFGAKDHRLRHRLFYLLIDLDRFTGTARGLRMLGLNRPGPMSLREKDYGEKAAGRPLKDWARGEVRRAGIKGTIDKVWLLTMPRVLGYAFNPISLYFCCDGKGQLRAIIYEVNNTFGGRAAYTLGVDAASRGGIIRQRAEKTLHVSPFFRVEGGYRFRTAVPGGRFKLFIRYADGTGNGLDAGLALKRRELSDFNLLRALVEFPLLTLRVILNIHLHALRLWLNGVPFHGAGGRAGRARPAPRRAKIQA